MWHILSTAAQAPTKPSISTGYHVTVETWAGIHSCSRSHPSWQFYFPHPSLTSKISSLTHPEPTRLFPFPAPSLTHYSLSLFTHVNKKFYLQLICIVLSDVKFQKFCHEIFHEICCKIFLKYFKNFTMDYGCSCTVHCNKVSKPVKDKYLLLCMNSIMYFLLTSYTLTMF